MKRTSLIDVGLLLLLFSSAPMSYAEQAGVNFSGHPDAPDFSLAPRNTQLSFYPCKNCHQSLTPNPTVRDLRAPHPIELAHGQGQLWCLNCHHGPTKMQLLTPIGEGVAYDQAHLVCSGCHADKIRDWSFGAHGKRLDNWQGERVIVPCTNCHDPHKPAIAARKPKPPPPTREGLDQPVSHAHPRVMPWQKRTAQEESAHE